MRLSRRNFLDFAAGAAALPALSRVAYALNYPTRPVTLVAPWPAGGAVDILCRALAAPFSDRLGKAMVVENRPGAGSVVGVASVARANPDGYTLVMAGSAALAISVSVYKKPPYDSIKDFAPIGLVTRIPFVLVVNPSLPVQNVQDLIALAKSKPGQLSYASGGPGSAASPIHGAVQEHDRDQHGPCSLPRHNACANGRHRQQHPGDVCRRRRLLAADTKAGQGSRDRRMSLTRPPASPGNSHGG